MILLGKSYAGYAAGTIVQLATQEEAALVAQGLASTSAGKAKPSNAAAQRMRTTNASPAPWKNSRVLNEPPIAPCERCSMRCFSAPAAGAAPPITSGSG